jgi:pSer/pThr/pTyr-binding forkhead associated (FHA) protein
LAETQAADLPRLSLMLSPESTTFALPPGKTVIRRSEENTISVHDRAVSRNQAIVTCEDGQLYILQDGDGDGEHENTNGTWVNGKKLANGAKHILQQGDEIRAGETRLRFEGS